MHLVRDVVHLAAVLHGDGLERAGLGTVRRGLEHGCRAVDDDIDVGQFQVLVVPKGIERAALHVNRTRRRAVRRGDPEGLPGRHVERKRVVVQHERRCVVAGVDHAEARRAADEGVRREFETRHLRLAVGAIGSGIAQRAEAVRTRSRDLVVNGVPVAVPVEVERRAVQNLDRLAVVRKDRRGAVLHDALRHRDAGEVGHAGGENHRARTILDELTGEYRLVAVVEGERRARRNGHAEIARAGEGGVLGEERSIVGGMKLEAVEVYRSRIDEAVRDGRPLRILRERDTVEDGTWGDGGGADEAFSRRNDPCLTRRGRALGEVRALHVLEYPTARAVEKRTLPGCSLHGHEVAHNDVAVLHEHGVEAELRVVRVSPVRGEHAEVDDRVGRAGLRDFGGRPAAVEEELVRRRDETVVVGVCGRPHGGGDCAAAVEAEGRI